MRDQTVQKIVNGMIVTIMGIIFIVTLVFCLFNIPIAACGQ